MASSNLTRMMRSCSGPAPGVWILDLMKTCCNKFFNGRAAPPHVILVDEARHLLGVNLADGPEPFHDLLLDRRRLDTPKAGFAGGL